MKHLHKTNDFIVNSVKVIDNFVFGRYDSDCAVYVAHCRRILKALSEYIHCELTSVGVKIVLPMGGFYMMPDFEVSSLKCCDLQYFCFVLNVCYLFFNLNNTSKNIPR